MNTIVNKIRFALILGFITMSVAAWSQGVPYINKMSITTQMFLEERDGRLTFDQEVPPMRSTSPDMRPLPKPRRPYAAPDTIDGKVYIAATVRITNESDLSELKSKGVIIQCKFDKGLVTTLIPVDKIEEVAAIDGVKRINVSALMRPLTNLARQTTNVDDVLTLSADALGAGLNSIYDGSGVILGVIDDGIDFQHGAFKDKNGNTRLKRAYCYNGSSATYWQGSGTLPTTDDNSEDHGTHTSTIAGGSSVIVSGTNVTVTDDHANATYGGMAPGADLFLAGTRLSTNYILNAFQYMSEYADQVGKPLVVSNSWGSAGWFARDGDNDMSDVLAQYFGDNHPNRICLFAAGNEAGRGIESGLGGGMYVTGTASQDSPLGTIVRSVSMVEYYGYQYYNGLLANAWTRATDATGIGINIHVINKSNGSLYRSYNYTSTNSNTQNSVTLAGLNLSVYVLFDYIEGQSRHQVAVYTSNYATTSTYVFAIEVYPIGGSNSIMDIYGGSYTYLTNYVNTSNHTWVNGTDDLSVGDESMDPNVISVGSYVTRNGTYSTGDISDFSSYATPGSGPTGVQHPWITAPGEVIISGYNHYVSSTNHDALVVNNSTAPYGQMSGTSMACPMAAGIVALWLQASMDDRAQHKNLTVNDVKQIMAETAIKDSWVTSGPHASHFGNGKIDALAGIQYILGLNGGTITVDPTELTFGGSDFYAGYSQSQTVTVTNNTDEALHLTIAGLNASLSGTPFSVTAITNNGNVAAGGGTVTITITYAPTTPSTNDQATLIIAEDVTVALTGSCVQEPDPYAASVNPVVGTLPYGTVTIGNAPTKTITITNEGLNPFTPVVSVSAPFTASYDNSQLAHGESRTITVTFTPTQETSYSEILTITALESSDISFTYTLTGTGEAPYIAGTVDPTTLNFTNKVLGQTYTANVTISNTGTQAFTPVINTDNLPAQYTVTGNGEVAIGGSINLTVTYAPTAVGTHNGSFTVTLGNETYTVNVYGSAVEVTSATVCDGTDSNYTLPIYGNYYNNKQINQMIYPSELLSEIQGKTITSMKFYPTIPIDFSGGAFTVKMGMTSTAAYTSSRNYSRITANMTTVKTGQVAVSGENELVITFDEPFEYTGNNLVIDFEVTQTGTTTNTTTYFYGVNQNSTYRSFNSYGSTTNSYGRYTNGSRRAFLPKVTFEWQAPFTAGTVSPNALTFTDVRIGRSDSKTVTVTNTGTLPFTPVIDTSNLPSEFTVTGNDEVLPNGTLDLTVTYSPTDEGPHSGSFTVTIGDVTYTVTVTGNGIVVNCTLTSNSVTVPVYKTDLDVYGPYTYGQVIADTQHQLKGDVTNGLVKVQAKNIDAITDYRLFHNAGAQNNTVNMENWASGNNQSSVAYAVHNIANDNFTTYAKNGNAWAQDAVYTFQNGVEEMWIDLHDNIEVGGNVDTWYVPVTVANSKLGNENTYGSRMEQNPKLDGDVIVNVGYDDSSRHREYLDPATGMNYVYLTTQAEIIAHLPNEINGHTYECVMARAWRYYKPYIIGEGPSSDYVLELIDESTEIAGENGIINCVIGSESWTETNSNDGFLFNDYTFCVKDGDQSNVAILARLYYKRSDVVNPASGLRLSGSDGGYFAMDGDNDLPDEPTSVSEYFYDKELVSVTFVNPQGMTSSRPFEGVNIVVKRYSDGSTSTSKVLKR